MRAWNPNPVLRVRASPNPTPQMRELGLLGPPLTADAGPRTPRGHTLQATPGATHAPHPFCHHRAYDRNGSARVQAGVYQVCIL